MTQDLLLLQLDLVTYINDENLDLLEEFSDDEIALQVIEIANRLLHSKVVCCKLFDRWNVKVRNHRNGFVTVSDGENTGVANTAYYPFRFDEEEGSYFAGLCTLAHMINEAWFLCNN
jgi:hypothetical protein